MGDFVTLDHGSGGLASHRLINELFAKQLGDAAPDQIDDAAVLTVPAGRLAVSTDSFVVDPLIFPGGDIGSLAVHGTVNDVAMRGARPLWLTAGFVLEEGLPLDTLARIVESMGRAAGKAGVRIVAGDTKVVGRGQADGLFINTTGIGVINDGLDIGVDKARPGDALIISGTMGDHGATVMAARSGLGLDAPIKSDSAALNHMAQALVEACGNGLRLMTDPTRGGLATAVKEIAQASGVAVELEQAAIPVDPAVDGVCELLGLDPLYLANEGKMVVVVEQGLAEKALETLRGFALGSSAARIGSIVGNTPGRVWLNTAVGGRRVLEMLTGEPLPRIC